MDRSRRPGRHVATAAVAGFGLLVALVGAAVVTHECEVACGTAADQAFRDAMGYVALVLGAASIALAVTRRRVLATAAASSGAIACLAAYVEALSHLS